MKRMHLIIAALLVAAGCFAQTNDRIPAKGFAVFSEHGSFRPYDFSRHPIGDNDIRIDILYSGICHSDIHTAHGDWGDVQYPLVPGHEIAGRVVAVGKNVTKFRVGDYAGVGCMVNSCGTCPDCQAGHEQGCAHTVYTYASTDIYHDNEPAQGGYSNTIDNAYRNVQDGNVQFRYVIDMSTIGNADKQ